MIRKDLFSLMFVLVFAIADSYGMEFTSQTFRDAFDYQKEGSLYYISVARATIDNSDYPLIDVDSYHFVFCILNCLIRGMGDEIILASEKLLNSQKTQFLELTEMFEKEINLLNTDRETIVQKIIESNSKNLMQRKAFKDSKSIANQQFLKEILLKMYGIKVKINKKLSLENIELQQMLTSNTLLLIDKNAQNISQTMINSINEISEDVVNNKIEEQAIMNIPQNARKFFGFYKKEIEVLFSKQGYENLNFENYAGLFFEQKKKILLQECEKLFNVNKIYQLDKHWNLLVFNEMFFSKNIPLPYKVFIDISSNIRKFTTENKNVLLHANFLLEKNKNFEDNSAYQTFLQKQENVYNYLSSNLLNKQNNRELFDATSSTKLKNYKYLEHIANLKANNVISVTLNLIRNKSITFWDGVGLTSYKKSSYRDEANTAIENGALYLFGGAEDEILFEKNIEKIAERLVDNALNNALVELSGNGELKEEDVFLDELCNKATLLKKGEELAWLVQKYLSTEICYDLEIGIRQAVNKYPNPKTHKIHTIISNSLSLEKNIENLPKRSLIFLHVDPYEQEAYTINNEIKFNFSPEHIKETGKNIYHLNPEKLKLLPPLQSIRIGIGTEVFVFQLWDLKPWLKSVSFYKAIE